ncbi:hypothetical protein [Streptomyces sp. NPDC002851]
MGATFLTLLVMVLLPPLLVRAGVVGDGWCFTAFMAHIAAATVYLVATTPRRPERRGSLLTARTLFGRRTVDLNRLTRVRHLMIPGQTSSASVDWLLLTDEHGVRLAVQEPRLGANNSVDKAIARIVLSPSSRVRVSRGARERLRPEEYRPGSCLGMVAKGLFWAVLVCAVVGGVGIALLMVSISLAGVV